MRSIVNWLIGAGLATSMAGSAIAQTPAYFTATPSLHLTRDAAGTLTVEFNTNGGPYTFTPRDHAAFVDVFYAISRDRDNKVVIITGAGGEWITGVDFSGGGNLGDPDYWNNSHDDGVQILENIANIRVPVICSVEGKAWVHSEYCLLANVIIAGQGATFNDVPHFAGGLAPGDGIFVAWSYFAGPGRAQAFLLSPKPVSAEAAHEWGVVAEVTPKGRALARAQELATEYLKAPEVTRRYTRVIFIQPLKEQLVRQVGYGLAAEGGSAAAMMKARNAAKQ